jgi:putative membrane protein
MIAAFSPGSDFKRYYRGRMPRLAVAVIILMPLLYGALYLWAFWNPFGNVDNLPVAIVNLDEGAESQGETIDAGTQVVQGIVDSKQLQTHVVDEEEGVSGLEHGRYAFTVTIPADFSESIVSAATGDPRQAELIFTYNDANNYLSRTTWPWELWVECWSRRCCSCGGWRTSCRCRGPSREPETR